MKELPDFLLLPVDDAELAEEGQRDQSVGATHRQVARDLLQLAQVSLQLRRYVVWRRGGAGVRHDLKEKPSSKAVGHSWHRVLPNSS